MRQKQTSLPVVAAGIVIGAALGVVVGALFMEDVSASLALVIIIGAALGVVAGSVLDVLNWRRSD